MSKSSKNDLIPLLILLVVIFIAVAVGFVVYQIANEVADKTTKKMEKHNVSFGPDGMKVGVKNRTAEEVGDSTQSALMKMWNNSYFPAYKSRLGWGQSKDAATASGSASTTQRQTYARTTSQQSARKA